VVTVGSFGLGWSHFNHFILILSLICFNSSSSLHSFNYTILTDTASSFRKLTIFDSSILYRHERINKNLLAPDSLTLMPRYTTFRSQRRMIPQSWSEAPRFLKLTPKLRGRISSLFACGRRRSEELDVQHLPSPVQRPPLSSRSHFLFGGGGAVTWKPTEQAGEHRTILWANREQRTLVSTSYGAGL
jgi:hypothetical protein